jgi:ferredoxin-NADP reductase
LLIDVEDAEVTGNDAVVRSRLWTPGAHIERGAMPDLMALASAHLAANTATAKGGFLLKAIGKIPGISRLLRLVMNRAYRSGLLKEGYDDVETGAVSGTAKPDNPLREVRIVELRRETPSAVTLVLEDAGDRPGPFDFRPGQFFTLVADIDGRSERRAYSASSAPGTTRLEVTVKHVDGGRFSSWVHRSLSAGDRLAVCGPSGSFHLQPAAHDLVLIAAGSGVTPMMSMIRAQLADPTASSRISLLYSSRTENEVIFAAELARLARDHPSRLAVTHVLTSRSGRLTADGVGRWIATLSPTADTHYYVCGPEPLMDSVRAALTSLGVPDSVVHHERYTSATDVVAASTAPQELMVEQDGQPIGSAIVEPGQTLLDAGLAAGLPMPYSCTVGNCGDCMVKLRRGDVAQSEPNCLTAAQKADGYVLTCVGRPRSDITVDIAEL